MNKRLTLGILVNMIFINVRFNFGLKFKIRQFTHKSKSYIYSLTHFSPMSHFYTSCLHSKSRTETWQGNPKTSNMESSAIIVNDIKQLNIIAKFSIWDVFPRSCLLLWRNQHIISQHQLTPEIVRDLREYKVKYLLV